MITPSALLTHLAFGLFLFGLAAGLTRLMIGVRIIDIPNHRSSHDRPTPKTGGLAIAAAFFIGVVVLFLLSDSVRLTRPAFTAYMGLAGLLLAAVLADDVWDLAPLFKFAIQLACAVLFVVFIGTLQVLPIPGVGTVALGVWGPIGTVVWIVAVMNLVNFMDGVNGLVSGVALIAALALAALAAIADAPFVYLASLVLFAATAGFFVFNFPGGRIFMGDTGSQLLGFVFATLAVLGAASEGGHLSPYIVPILLFALLFDGGLTLAVRARRGARLSEAHRDHLYQILVRAGLGHDQVSPIYFGWAVACAGLAGLAQWLPHEWGAVVLVLLLLPFGGFAWAVYRYGARRGV